MANAIKMLQDDHNSVQMLCRQIPSLPGGDHDSEEKAALQLISMLETHTTLEEELVYPILADSHPELIKHAEEEHDEAASILAEIKKEPTGMGMREAVKLLEEAVGKHVAEEEETLFPALTEALGVSGLEDLGIQLLGRQQELMQAAADTTDASNTAMPKNVYPKL